jgi:hypothetical protein
VDLGHRLGRPLGLDTTGIVHASLPRYMQQAGLARIQMRTVALPIGTWGGPHGELMATGVRAVFARLGELYQSRLGVPAEECHELQSRAQEECERLRTSWSFTVFWAQRPAAGEVSGLRPVARVPSG